MFCLRAQTYISICRCNCNIIRETSTIIRLCFRYLVHKDTSAQKERVSESIKRLHGKGCAIVSLESELKQTSKDL